MSRRINILCIKIKIKTSFITRIRKSKKDRQHNGQKKKDNMTNNDLQNTTHKTKDQIARTPLIKQQTIN